MRQILKHLSITSVVTSQDKEKIPSKGPCIVVANHPFGAIEGIILAEMLLSIRPDVKIMANYLLNRLPQLQSLTIAVDPFEGNGAAQANLGPLRKAMRWVKEGSLLLVFPAGEVSHFQYLHREVSDPPWSHIVARVVHHAHASVVPIYFKSRNGNLFQAAGMLHPRLRTILLARELLRQRGKSIHYKIGNPISYRWLQKYTEDDCLMAYLRWRTYIMGHRRPPLLKRSGGPGFSLGPNQQPLALPQAPKICRKEIECLPEDQLLVQSGSFSVWVAQAPQIPHTMLEIGRLRELSFRLAKEGTGRPLDIDRFDQYYLHLFIWNEESEEIVGAYRLGRTDQILAEFGRKGLYTQTLFHSRIDFFQKLGPALEMGRSFIRPEYQKSYSSLLLLWRGIGTYISKNPQYRMLFGPVSISSDYSDLSRQLLATTLLRNSQAKDLALLVQPRKPAPLRPVRIKGCDRTTHDFHFQDFKEVCSVVSDIEFEQKDVPVLLRQYLNLGGQLLSFNIDKLFSRVMDGLIVVDLLQTDHKTLERYMGLDGVNTFLCHHCDTNEKESIVALGKAG
ncbi:MAG: lysophospholipid acyltransferase family protein [Desulfobacteraceae bacterium]|nr:lysophospholipid acyltransferase family protein [Desulfobacteraceae bacterium]